MHNMPLTKTLPILMKNLEGYEPEGINPTQLAQKTGVTQSTIHRIILGKVRDPRRSTVEILAKFFGLTYDQIYDIEFVTRKCTAIGIVESAADYAASPSVDAETADMYERFKAMSDEGQRRFVEGVLLDILRSEKKID